MRQTLDSVSADVVDWITTLAQNGPDLRVSAHLKVQDEAEEFAVDPQDIMEAADVFIALMGSLNYHNYTVSDFIEAVAQKLEVNRKRTWAQKTDGTWQHIAMMKE